VPAPNAEARPGGAKARLVSIVIPTYNRAHMVCDAVDACLAQTYPHIEVIVVNDGSTDETGEVLKKYDADDKVRVFSKPNEGIADTLNYGFARARGEYLTWTSDDNLYHPTAIAAMARYLDEHPDIGMVYTDVQEIDAEGRPLRIVDTGEPHLLETTCTVRGCLLYRREVMEAVGGYRREWVRCQDFDYYHRIWRRFPVAHLPEVHYAYRWHEASMSGDHAAHVREHARLLCTYARSGRERRRAWAWGFGELGRDAAKAGRLWRAAYYHLRAALLERGRFRAFRRSLKPALYAAAPGALKWIWRRLKRR